MRSVSVLFILLFSTTLLLAQQGWTANGVASSPAGNSASGFMEHQGDLYAWTNSEKLRKSTDGGSTWTTITTTGVPSGHRVDVLLSAGNRIYIGTFDPFTAGGVVVYSTDGGANFVTDTVGLADLTVGNKRSPRDMHYWGNYILVSQNSADAYFIKQLTDTVWTEDLFLKQVESDAFVSSGDTLFATADGGFHYTTDFGANWTTPANANMPSVYDVSDMVYDNGTCYISGANVFITEKDLYKSTDLGATWTRTNAYTYLRNNFIGQTQQTQQLLAKGGKLYLGLQNDAGNTTVDILVSDDGGDTFVLDTMGLPNDQFATGSVLQFIESNGTVYARVSGQDVYQQPLGGGSSGSAPAAPSNLSATSVPKQLTSDVTVTWQDNSNNETGFTIERSDDNSTWTQAGTVAANTSTYTDAGQAEGTELYYRVSASNGSGTSAFSNVVTITTGVTSVADIEAMNIRIYPNPTTGVVMISGLDGLYTELTVTNMLGKVVDRKAFNNTNAIKLELNGEAGIYFITLKTQAGITTHRLILE